MHAVQIKRIYAASDPDDGYRVLVDRLWPRGVRKEAAGIDEWTKTIAPSAELRKSFAHQPERFEEFRKAYRRELNDNPEAMEFARSCERELLSCNVTLLYAARDEVFNNASVLREWIREQVKNKEPEE